MSRRPRVFASVLAPNDTPALSPFPPCPRSLRYNGIGDKGATALAAILNETNITNLECAAPAKRLLYLSAPHDTPASLSPSAQLPAYSLNSNRIGGEGVTKLAEVLSQTKITILR